MNSNLFQSVSFLYISHSIIRIINRQIFILICTKYKLIIWVSINTILQHFLSLLQLPLLHNLHSFLIHIYRTSTVNSQILEIEQAISFEFNDEFYEADSSEVLMIKLEDTELTNETLEESFDLVEYYDENKRALQKAKFFLSRWGKIENNISNLSPREKEQLKYCSQL